MSVLTDLQTAVADNTTATNTAVAALKNGVPIPVPGFSVADTDVVAATQAITTNTQALNAAEPVATPAPATSTKSPLALT